MSSTICRAAELSRATSTVKWVEARNLHVTLLFLGEVMDRELPAESRTRIRKLALSHPRARDVHDLRTRRAGSDVFIELHLELEGDLNLEQAHEITHEVEGRIRAAFPDADILVHQEPAGLADERRDARIAARER